MGNSVKPQSFILRVPFPGEKKTLRAVGHSMKPELSVFKEGRILWFQSNEVKKGLSFFFFFGFPVLCGSSKVYFATNKSAEVGCTRLSPSFILSLDICQHSSPIVIALLNCYLYTCGPGRLKEQPDS